MERRDRVLEVLVKSPLTVKEVSDSLKIPVSTVYRMLKRLKEEGLVVKDGQMYHLSPRGREEVRA